MFLSKNTANRILYFQLWPFLGISSNLAQEVPRTQRGQLGTKEDQANHASQLRFWTWLVGLTGILRDYLLWHPPYPLSVFFFSLIYHPKRTPGFFENAAKLSGRNDHVWSEHAPTTGVEVMPNTFGSLINCLCWTFWNYTRHPECNRHHQDDDKSEEVTGIFGWRGRCNTVDKTSTYFF